MLRRLMSLLRLSRNGESRTARHTADKEEDRRVSRAQLLAEEHDVLSRASRATGDPVLGMLAEDRERELEALQARRRVIDEMFTAGSEPKQGG